MEYPQWLCPWWNPTRTRWKTSSTLELTPLLGCHLMWTCVSLFELCFYVLAQSILFFRTKNSKWVWSGNTTITNCRQPRGTTRKSRSTITRHQEDKLSKATSSLFPIKMIAILEWTLSNEQQNIEQLQTPTMGVTINKKSTTTEPLP